MWEDEANIKGGRWLFTVGKSSKEALDRIWLDILLMMVGESFEYATEICGAVVNIRAKSNKICEYYTHPHRVHYTLFEYSLLSFQLFGQLMAPMNWPCWRLASS